MRNTVIKPRRLAALALALAVVVVGTGSSAQAHGRPPAPAPTPVTRALVEDGERHLFGDRLIQPGCPVHILQGMEDVEVPFAVATGLVERLASDDVVLTLIKDGDHRLSRAEDLALLGATIEELVT